MAIEPNTNIKVYHNVPLDIEQDRSIAWANISEQNTYFHANDNILKYTFTRTTYQRVRAGVMRVEQTADNLYDCNYLAFQNTNYGNKWFYAFITSVEYINDVTTEITFVIDDLQTWFFEMNLQPCVIERCHTTTDVIGEHIEPEPVTLGEYVMNYRVDGQGTVLEEYKELTPLSELCMVIALIDFAHNFVDGKMYDGIYGSATLIAYNRSPNGVAALNQKIIDNIITPDNVLGIYMVPSSLIGATIPDSGYVIPNRALSNPVRVEEAALQGNEKLDGYTPRNKKLYTYPYHYFHVDNANGSNLQLRYEFFEGLRPRMEVSGVITQPCEITLRPYAYKNCTSSASAQVFQKTLNTEVLTLNTYPQCSWNIDGYQAWLVNTGIPYGVHAVGNVMRSGFNPMSFLNIAADSLDLMYDAKIQADISRGNFSNAGVNCVTGRQTFYGGRCSITSQFARIIDDYFDKYGYTCMRLQTPNLRARPHWTYIKTRDCGLNGNIPAVSKQNIKKYFNKGLTFWKSASEVGNYTLDNRV